VEANGGSGWPKNAGNPNRTHAEWGREAEYDWSGGGFEVGFWVPF